jgi:hypothetical protein
MDMNLLQFTGSEPQAPDGSAILDRRARGGMLEWQAAIADGRFL